MLLKVSDGVSSDYSFLFLVTYYMETNIHLFGIILCSFRISKCISLTVSSVANLLIMKRKVEK